MRNEGGGFAANIYGRCPKVACDWGLSRIVISSVSKNSFLLSPSLGRGTPEGQGVGRRRNRAKPTSGATRHLLPEEGGRNRSKCIDLYTSSLKAGYSYSLFMNLHNLILRLNQRFLNTRRFSPLRMTKCAVPLPPSPLNLQNPLPPLWQTIKGQHAPGANL